MMMMVMMLQCAVGSSSGTPGGDTCVTWCKQAYASSRGCGGGSGVEGGGGEGASWQQLTSGGKWTEGAGTGGRWQGQLTAAGTGGSRVDGTCGPGCCGRGSWQQGGGVVPGGSWGQAQGAEGGGSWQQRAVWAREGGSRHEASAVVGGSRHQARVGMVGVAGGSRQQECGAVPGSSRHWEESAVLGGTWQQPAGAGGGGSWQQPAGAVAGDRWQLAGGAVAAGSRHQAEDEMLGGCWRGTAANRSDSSSVPDGDRGRSAFGEARGRDQGGRGTAAPGSISRGAASAASGCSKGVSQWEPALSVADRLLEPLDCQVHVNDMSKFWASLSCGYAHASVAGRGGLCVVTAGLSVCAVPIVGLCHHCWGEGIPLMWDYDLATVDCWQSHSTCHCLQQSRQFGLGVSRGVHGGWCSKREGQL